MSRLGDTALIGGERSDAVDHCLAGISRLSSEVKDASSYLPTYDQRVYAEVCHSKPLYTWHYILSVPLILLYKFRQ